MRDIIRAGRLAGTFRAVHQPTGHPVLLVFFGGSRPSDPVSWATTVASGMQCFALDDPQLATCHEMVDMGVFRFAVLDDLSGQVLAEVLQNGRPLSVPHAAGLLYDVAEALDKLHACGQSHGDVRPENIMVTDDGHGQLLYFPLSRTDYTRCVPLDAQAADYAAPELNPQQPLPTPAADIYALGCTFYHALSGRPPFADPPADVAQKMVRHATQPIVPLHQQSPSHQKHAVPEAVNLVVSYMMAKNVRTRYRDAKTVMASLRPWLNPSQAPPAALPATRAAYQGVAERRRATVAAAAVQARDAVAAVATSPPPPPPPPTAAGMIPDTAGTPAVDPQEFGRVNANPVAGQTVTPGPRSPVIEQPWWQKRATKNKLIAAGSTVLIALVAIVAVTRMGPETTPQQTLVAEEDAPPAADPNSEQPVSEKGSDESASVTTDGALRPSDVVVEKVIGDDGRTLWASPTLGSPPDLRYIPVGAQTVFMLRTADLFSEGSGKGLLAAMGPAGGWLADWIKTETTFELDEIERLDIALYAPEAGEIEYSLVVYPSESLPKEGLLARWGKPAAERYAEGSYFLRGQTAFYIPQGQANAFACGPVKQMRAVIDTLEEAAWLAVPLEKLRLQTAAQRHVNILFLPDFLRSTRETLYPGRLSPLHEVVSWVLGPGEDVQAGLLSAHSGAQLFLELRLFCARQKKPQVIARELYGRLGQAAGRLSGHLLSLSVSQYSQPVLAGMPGMLHSLHQYARHDR
ncbi:MAG: protein kinase, partial [Planctomycetota bacterium]|nr:protein kinase [Planctomycetota bacterium]